MKRNRKKSTLSDLSLIAKMKDGDSYAFTCIYDRYWEMLYRKAYQRLQDESASKDVVQNVFIDLWSRKKTIKIDHLKSYLYGAVRFQVLKQINKSQKFDPFFDLFDQMLISPIQTDGEVIRDDLAKLLLCWIETLPKRRQEIFVLHYKQQLSVEEIAQELNITRKTVYNQLNETIKNLQWNLARFTTLLLIISMS